MGTLLLFNFILIMIVTAALFGVKKCARGELLAELGYSCAGKIG